MTAHKKLLVFCCVTAISFGYIPLANAVNLNYAGTHEDIGGTFFPGGGPADTQSYVVVPWRTDGAGNTFSASSEVGERYYGKDGYALFGTRFDYPNANDTGGAGAPPGDAFFEAAFPNLIDLPGFVADSQILASRVVGGYGYALIDDPTETAGNRDFAWGEGQSPQSFGQAPYVKIGILNGWDQFGNDPTNPTGPPAGRWGFEVGAGAPASFRVGVMTGGLDNGNFSPEEVFLANVSALGSGAILDVVSTGSIDDDRFVDIHFFDITGAQEGEFFAFGVKAHDGAISFGNSGVSGFTFDILADPPALVGDYNGDGSVDAADYTVWRDTEGQSVTIGEGADGDNSGVIDAGDYTVWVANFGESSSNGIAVPEPGSAMLLAAAGIGLAIRRRRSL